MAAEQEIARLQQLVNLLEEEIDRCHATIEYLREKLSEAGRLGEIEAERSATSAP
jgi:vacuolar-type H+-ATPase subunit D/Vma8